MRPSRRPARAPASAAFAVALLGLLMGGCSGQEVHTVPPDGVLLDPSGPAFTGPAPETFRVRFETSQGAFVVQVVRDWAPRGADRFYHLVRSGFYDGTRFYRAVQDFMVQFGVHGDPAVTAAWLDATIDDDPVRTSNERGRISFAAAGPDTRTTELFINLRENARLDPLGFAPFGEVVEGMDVVDRLHTGYGEVGFFGPGPVPDRIYMEGNEYLERDFPALDHIVRATLVP